MDQELIRLGELAKRGEWPKLAGKSVASTGISRPKADLLSSVHSLARFNIGAQQAANAWRSGRTVSPSGSESRLARLTVSRLQAAVEGNSSEARSILANELGDQPVQTDAQDLGLPVYDVIDLVTRGIRPEAELRVRGIARPLPDNSPGFGDPGSFFTLGLAGLPVGSFERGRPLDLVGSWDSPSATFTLHRVVRLGLWLGHRVLLSELGISEREDETVACRPTDSAKPQQKARSHRNLVAETLALRKSVAMIDQDATNSSLSFGTLCEVHRLLAPDAPQAGCLRSAPATVRLGDVPFYRAPNPSIAQVQVTKLLEWLRSTSSTVHPLPRAAEAWARFSRAHPFTDGNGRVARALATWVLTASGYQLSGARDLRDIAHQHGVEHYYRLRRWSDERLLWYHFCADAVLEAFERAAPAESAHQVQCQQQ